MAGFGPGRTSGAVIEIVMAGLEIVRRSLEQLGPYLIVELLLPGGSLIALLLFLVRRWRLGVKLKSATTASCAACFRNPVTTGADRVMQAMLRITKIDRRGCVRCTAADPATFET